MEKSTVQRFLLLVASASLAVGLMACGGDDDNDDDTNPTSPVATNTTAASNDNDNGDDDDDNNGDDKAEEVTILLKDNVFEPKDITIPVGKEVEITVKNEGIAVHNMHVLDTDFKSDQLVMAGDDSSFKVKFDEAGTYDFQCDYHVPDMVGTITVK